MTPYFFLIALLAVSVPVAFAVFYDDITAADIINQVYEVPDDIQAAQLEDIITSASEAGTMLASSSEHGLIDNISRTNTMLASSSQYSLIDDISDTHTLLLDSSTGSVTGIVYEDANGNDVQDADEEGIEGYRMLAIDYSTLNVMETYTAADGTYSFNIAPSATTLIQTWYYPPGTTVAESDSWYRYLTPKAGQTATFDVGFYPVPPEDRVTLNITAYGDDSLNGVMDAGESPIGDIGGLYVRTYTIGPVANLVTDGAGMATVTDLVPSDFAVLVYQDPDKPVDALAEAGYVWANTSYIRDDGVTIDYPTLPVAVNPAPGSIHTMLLGLSPTS